MIRFNILILLVLLNFTGIALAGDGDGDRGDVLPVATPTSGGGKIAPQTCDSQVWQAMQTRAEMETEREVMQNQNLIFKPDSILSYTCFDNFAAHASKNIGVLFTHTTYFNGTEVIPWGAPYGIDNAMQNAVIASMKPYISTNFDHSYLGGRGQYMGLNDRATAQDIGNQGRGYSCNVMNQVWQTAKSMNFIHATEFRDTDGYYPFANLAATTGGSAVAGYETINDTRKFPSQTGVTQPMRGSTWIDSYRHSRNENSFGVGDPLYQFQTPNNKIYNDVRNLVKPGSCGTAIKTGVKVILSPAESSSYDDGVCTNPGCSYDKGGTCK